MPEEVDLRVSAIFGIIGFQRILAALRGTIRSVHGGACSVRSKWERAELSGCRSCTRQLCVQ